MYSRDLVPAAERLALAWKSTADVTTYPVGTATTGSTAR
jgi:hypothetical protein